MTGGAPARLSAVGVHYGDEVWGLRELDLELVAGEILALVGANGSGKSTLLSLLAGQRLPNQGRLELFGRAAGAVRPDDLRRQIVLVPQDPALDPELSPHETLAYFAALWGMARVEARAAISELLSLFGLDEVAERGVARLSGGQRQRLHLAIGLLPRSRLLLLDEPSQALDPHGREAFWRILARRRDPGGAVVIATHELPEAEALSDRILVLAEGRAVALGSAAEIRIQAGNAPDLAAAFEHLTGQRPGAAPPRGGGRGRGRRS